MNESIRPRLADPAAGRILTLACGVLALMLGGCAGFSAPDCEDFKQVSKDTDYDTHYQFAEYETEGVHQFYDSLPKPELAAARLYRISLSDERTSVCTNIHIRKDLYLERGSSKAVLEQVREFYTEGGRLIATKRENVTAQLGRSGYFSATVPLPIPKAAPPGRYRIVSKLVVRAKPGAREYVLAQAAATFEVEPNAPPNR